MPKLFRKRLIPEECTFLKDDTIVYADSDCIITTWSTLRPKAEFSHGISYYCIDKGWKISKFLRSDNELCYIYCDIIETEYNKDADEYIFTDLLADVIIENSGFVRVVDLDELAEAHEKGLISDKLLISSLNKLDNLLTIIYHNQLKEYTDKIDKYL